MAAADGGGPERVMRRPGPPDLIGPPAPQGPPPPPQGPPLPPMPGRSDGPADTETDRPRRWPWLVGGLLALLLAGAVLAWLMLRGSPPETTAPPPPLVNAARAQAATRAAIRQTGFVRPVAEVQVASEISARIAEVGAGFRRGLLIEEGALLVRLETRRLEADLGRAEAAVRRAEAAVAEARVERDRQEELEEREFASEAALQQAIVAVASEEANLASARADLVLARTRLGDAEIRAPFDALVVESDADVGDLASAGAVLGTIVAARAAELELGLTPADLALLRDAEIAVGGRVLVRGTGEEAVAAGRDPEEAGGPLIAAGVVVAVGPAVQPGTRTVPLIVRVPEPFDPGRGWGRPLRLDELVSLEMPVSLERRQAVAVPSEALKGGDVVWELVEGEAGREDEAGQASGAEDGEDEPPPFVLRRHEVRVLLREGERAVVEGGPEPGARVLLSDLPAAADGFAVRLEAEGGEGDAPAGGEG